MNIAVIITVIVLIILGIFTYFYPFDVKLEDMIRDDHVKGMSGGHMNDVLREIIISDKVLGFTKDHVDDMICNVINGIRAYKREKHIETGNEDVEYIGQGCFNVVVKIGANKQLLRVAKYIKESSFKFRKDSYRVISKYKDSCGFMLPTSFRYHDKHPQYIYWEIPELVRIDDHDYEKYAEIVQKSLDFLQRRDVNLVYKDYKYTNVMMDPVTKEYKLIDFDLYPNLGLRHTYTKKTKQLDVKEIIGKSFQMWECDRVINEYIAPMYFGTDNEGYIRLDKLPDGFRGNMLLMCLWGRFFLLKVKQDKELGRDLNVLEQKRMMTITEDVVKNMLSMKGTSGKDVITF